MHYKAGKNSKIFDNLLISLSTAKTMHGVYTSHICAIQMENLDIIVQLLICMKSL